MQTKSVTAWIGLGSNLDDPAAQIKKALVALGSLPQSRLISHSHCYRSAAMGGMAQPDFINAVAGIETDLDAEPLFDALMAIEKQAGRERQREIRWGPRRLDLDLLLYGQQQINSGRLQVPHPQLQQRAFVLAPLAELAGDWILPGDGRTVAAVWAAWPNPTEVLRIGAQ